ncbi:phage tail protein [Bacillus atrophaeus]|uniref:prophage endopeptidase tail family protein n=1 Tax=Bacillus atrophaeus TaxID=1452 RepID=UPI001EFC10A0|nr:prophage endopeptidase tail family protein [Bacillus atrophaeus]MCG8395693.1 phage tail protein [Bacillus atrophaeus]
MYVLDRNTKTKYGLPFVEPKVNDNVNGKKDLSFSITLNEANQLEFNALVGRNFILIDEVRFKAQQYFINTPSIKQEGELLSKDITATHIYAFRASKHIVHDTIEGTKSLDEALSHALKDSEFTYVIMEDAKGIKPVKLEGFGAKKSLELMDEIITNYGVEIIVDNTKIYVYKKAGKEIVKTLDSTVNLKSLTITITEDNTTTRVKGYGKAKEEKDTLGDESLSYKSKTGTWSYDDSLKADFTKKIGSSFTFSFTGTGFKFKTLVSKLGGKWEFKIGDKKKTISVYKKDANPTEQEFDIIRGLENKEYSVTATFKNRDSNNPNTKTAKKTDPVMYLLRGNIITVYRTFKNENEKYIFPPVVYKHPDEKKFLINGEPSWAETVTDDSIKTKEDMEKLLKTKVNPYPEVTFDVDYNELIDTVMAGVEDVIQAGDTIRVIAKTRLNGITYDEKIRITGNAYNPLDLSQAQSLTINGGYIKSRIDLEIEEKKRAKSQEQAIKNYEAQLKVGLAEISMIKQQNNSETIQTPNTYTYSIEFTGGQWNVVTGEGFISIDNGIVVLNTDDDFEFSYVTCEPSTELRNKGITLSSDYQDTDKVLITFTQDGKALTPTTVPDGSRVKILIIGTK